MKVLAPEHRHEKASWGDEPVVHRHQGGDSSHGHAEGYQQPKLSPSIPLAWIAPRFVVARWAYQGGVPVAATGELADVVAYSGGFILVTQGTRTTPMPLASIAWVELVELVYDEADVPAPEPSGPTFGRCQECGGSVIQSTNGVWVHTPTPDDPAYCDSPAGPSERA